MKTTIPSINVTEIFPILGPDKPCKDWAAIDLEKPFLQMHAEELPVNYLFRILDEVKQISGKNVLYGGYLEKRIYYSQSTHFRNDLENRNIHLGIDVWDVAGTVLYAPIDMTIHSFRYNDNYLDYGATIITKLDQGGFLLFGHLSLDSLQGITIGQQIHSGTAFAKLGSEKENGGWPPHLHIQYILDIADHQGDFPGVVSEANATYYKDICPNPSVFLKLSPAR